MSTSGYLLIADISGYTNFVKLHNLRKKPVVGKFLADNFEFHAEAIISDLLETIIEVIEPVLKLNKLEGDAAFFYCDDKGNKNQADQILEVMDNANKAFNEKASKLVFVQACGCEPCLESKNLKLKIVAHKGIFAIKKIRNFEELAGEDVILIHRMLKNNIESNEYWMVTDNFSKLLNSRNKNKFSPIIQNLESFGKMKFNYLLLKSPEPKNSIVEKRSRLFNWFVQAAYFSSAKFRKKQFYN